MNNNEGTAGLIILLVIGWTYHILVICALILSGKAPYVEHLAPARWRRKN